MAVSSWLGGSQPLELSSISMLYKVFLLYVVYFVVSLGSAAIYNVFFHPLRKIPGRTSWIAFPILANIYAMRGIMNQEISRMHEEYGEMVRFKANDVSFTSAQAWKDIYGHGHQELPKFFAKGSRAKDEPKIVSADARDHFRLRRAMLPAFSDKALAQQERLILVYVDKLVARLREVSASHQPADMVKWYTFTTFDLIGDLTFGESFNGLDSGRSHQWISNIERLFSIIPLLMFVNALPIIGTVIGFCLELTNKGRRAHESLAHTLTRKRIARVDAERRHDFMDIIMRSRGSAHEVTDDELAANADTLIIAGSETTATTLAGVTFYLLSNSEALQKCVAEVRSAFASDDEINFKDASSRLPYMLSCLDEALRLLPPAPLALLRVTNQGNPTPIAGHMIPPGTNVGVHQLAAFHSARNFHKPKEFVPERWSEEALTDPTNIYHNDKRDAFKPFSYGPRDCIGRKLAYHEMRLVLAKVLFNFDLELVPESKVAWDNIKIKTLWSKPPLMVEIKERKA